MSETKSWTDERIKQRAAELDGELFDGNTRPWQHYMTVWQTLAYEVRDDMQAQIDAQAKQIDEANKVVFAQAAQLEWKEGLIRQLTEVDMPALEQQLATLQAATPVGLDAPDGVGLWAFEGVVATPIGVSEKLRWGVEVTLNSIDNNMYAHSTSGHVKMVQAMSGKWTRLHMPWDATNGGQDAR